MNYQHENILHAATRAGIEATDLDEFGESCATLLRYNGHEELVVDGHFLSQLTLQNQLLCLNKALTKQLFHRQNISSPKSIVLQHPEAARETIEAFLQRNVRSVCKPLSGTHGVDVFMNITSYSDFHACNQQREEKDAVLILEEQVDGRDLRLQAVNGELIAACVREPAYVVGDGQTTVKQLIETRQQLVREQNPDNRLDIDEAVLEMLKSQQLTMQSIAADGDRVQLKNLANMSQGAIATDVTEEIHPEYREWVRRIAGETGMTLFALDIMTADYSRYESETTWALEINAQPVWLHHTFSERRRHDVAGLILKKLFFDSTHSG